MKERIEQFLATAENKETRDVAELKAIYEAIGEVVGKCESDTCINKMLNAIKKYYHLNFVATIPPVRKYTLKPGNHGIAPGGPCIHNNDNTSDEDIEALLPAYPHIKDLLITE